MHLDPFELLRPLEPCSFCAAPPTHALYTLSLHDALPIWRAIDARRRRHRRGFPLIPADGLSRGIGAWTDRRHRSEEHTSELQSRGHLVCRLLLEKKKNQKTKQTIPILPLSTTQ